MTFLDDARTAKVVRQQALVEQRRFCAASATTPETYAAWDSLVTPGSSPADVVTATLDTLDLFGYDSVDRENLFLRACERFGWDYSTLYDLWLEGAST